MENDKSDQIKKKVVSSKKRSVSFKKTRKEAGHLSCLMGSLDLHLEEFRQEMESQRRTLERLNEEMSQLALPHTAQPAK